MNEYCQEFNVRRGFALVKDIFAIIDGRGYIAGSYAAYMASPASKPIQPGDVDIFATSDDNALYINNALCIKYHVNPSFNGLVYSISNTGNRLALPVQVVNPNPEWRIFPDDIINSFDMDISRALLLSPNSVLADVNVGQPSGKLLRIASPLRSLKRVMKYHKRGVQFEDSELVKLFLAWQQLSEERRAEILSPIKAQGEGSDNSDNDGREYAWFDEDDYFEGE